MPKSSKCCVCNRVLAKAGHCADCRVVQDNIRFIHDKYPGRSPHRDIREQMILEHQARISAHLEPAGDSA